MKQPENNEIDSLLRGLASHERFVPTGLAENVTGAHLDADELSSYAEGALPPSTRARYTSHLADCDDCRKIVTQLSLAAGPIINETPISQSSATSNWRKMLAALFAPAMLRYAMPALVLIVVGVSFFAWQQQRRELVAINNGQQQISTAKQPDSALAKEQSGAFAETRKAETPAATRAQNPTDKAGEKAEKTSDTAKPASVASTTKEPERNEVAGVAQPAYAPEPAPPPAAAKAATASEAKENDRVAGELANLKPAAARKREADKQTEKTRADTSASASGAVAADAPTAGKDDDRKKQKAATGGRGAERDEESETRAVGGRRFQRRNNIWVDAAYNSSLSITTVPRGSEQYRALVADERVIDSIAKQLTGEVIVVWKGRAYRIR